MARCKRTSTADDLLELVVPPGGLVEGRSADGGVDLVLTKPGKNCSEKLLVQCKQWRAYKIGVDVLREL